MTIELEIVDLTSDDSTQGSLVPVAYMISFQYTSQNLVQ